MNHSPLRWICCRDKSYSNAMKLAKYVEFREEKL